MLVRVWALLLFGLGLAACIPPERGRYAQPGTGPLDANWLEGGSQVTPGHLARVFALGQNDPHVQALLRDAQQRLGGGRLEGLAERFRPCDEAMAHEGGLTLVKTSDAWVARSVDELATGIRSPQTVQRLAELQKSSARDVRIVELADFIQVERTLMPEICILPRLSLGEAYEAIVHELVHALRSDPRKIRATTDPGLDEHAYQMAHVLSPGGEVEAYTVSTGARIRLGSFTRRIPALYSYFDPRSGAALTTPERLGEAILSPRPRGIGYGQGRLRDALVEARRSLLQTLTGRRDAVTTILEDRRSNFGITTSNVEVFEHNVNAHRHNLGVAQQRGERALIEKSRAGLSEAQQHLVKTRAMLDAIKASEARLAKDREELAAQIEMLTRLLGGS